MKVFGSIPLANTFLDEPKKCKKKKVKKQKKEKSDKQKSKPKAQPSLNDYADIYDSNLFAQWPEIKKKKRRKKPDVSLNEEFLLRQNKNLKLSKRHKQNRNGNCAVDTHAVKHSGWSGPCEQEAAQSQKKHKKRVVFNLSPVLLKPQPHQNPFVVRDIFQTQRSGMDKKPPFSAVCPADGRHTKPTVEEHGTGSQSTSDDINSQDLFITQKSFSDPYIDLCSSTSAEEVLEHQGYPETWPGHQSFPKKPPCPAYHPSPPKKPSHRHKVDVSTQTENFFTAPVLATSLRFRHWSTCTEEPMDLSLPERSRVQQQDAVSKAFEDQRHPELTQSDDSDSHVKSKADLSQLKVVQMRLNESFFFKLKGEADSPKPRSPLMKFTGSVEKKKP